jgi:hypothetical protein
VGIRPHTIYQLPAETTQFPREQDRHDHPVIIAIKANRFARAQKKQAPSGKGHYGGYMWKRKTCCVPRQPFQQQNHDPRWSGVVEVSVPAEYTARPAPRSTQRDASGSRGGH